MCNIMGRCGFLSCLRTAQEPPETAQEPPEVLELSEGTRAQEWRRKGFNGPLAEDNVYNRFLHAEQTLHGVE